MFGERLKRARHAASLSMKELGSKVGVSANMIKKYEHGQSMPSSTVLLALSKTLNVRSEYFFRPVQLSMGQLNYRKRPSLRQGTIKAIEAEIHDHLERWQLLDNLWPNPPFRCFNEKPIVVKNGTDVERLAEGIRDRWGLGRSPIAHLTEVIEQQGIIVMTSDVPTNNTIDGMSMTAGEWSIIGTCCSGDGARQRFTLAHELGHLLLESSSEDDFPLEQACHRFAQALLFPKESVIRAIGHKRHTLAISELYHLKHLWGISMQAICRRAFDLKIINEYAYRELCKTFSKRDWRRREPGKMIEREESTRFEQLVWWAISERIITQSKGAELLRRPIVDVFTE
ncbi:MAG: XRE family transcriptional regulator [Sphaerochaeta sp.]|jgi:Zn-dependent peptidase ImmA (M78 family)/transcriptional regulator with XRE-family HTH domain|nr:ImmA/IrrE family metallo-endopeptidase [Spirochaetales bacterium]